MAAAIPRAFIIVRARCVNALTAHFTTQPENRSAGTRRRYRGRVLDRHRGAVLAADELDAGIELLGQRRLSLTARGTMRADPATRVALVVEDELLVRDHIVRELKAQGWSVVETASGEDALWRFAKLIYSLPTSSSP